MKRMKNLAFCTVLLTVLLLVNMTFEKVNDYLRAKYETEPEMTASALHQNL